MTGADLRAARERLSWTQLRLARRLGVAKDTVSKWERGVLAIAHPEILGLAMRYLLRTHRARAP